MTDPIGGRQVASLDDAVPPRRRLFCRAGWRRRDWCWPTGQKRGRSTTWQSQESLPDRFRAMLTEDSAAGCW